MFKHEENLSVSSSHKEARSSQIFWMHIEEEEKT